MIKKHYIIAIFLALIMFCTGCETLQKINPLVREFSETEQYLIDGVVTAGTVAAIENNLVSPEQVLVIVTESREGLLDRNLDLVNFKRILKANGLDLSGVDPQYKVPLNLLLTTISIKAQEDELSDQKLFELNALLDWVELAALQYMNQQT